MNSTPGTKKSLRLFDGWIQKVAAPVGDENWDQAIEAEKTYHKHREKNWDRGGTILAGILYDMDLLDTKSTGLLTHISMIIAALAFLSTSSSGQGHWLVSIILNIEISLYVLCALFLLRCLNIMGQPKMFPNYESQEKLIRSYCHEVLLRKWVYAVALRTTWFLTAVLVPTLILKFATS